jgi:hypothetical protein
MVPKVVIVKETFSYVNASTNAKAFSISMMILKIVLKDGLHLASAESQVDWSMIPFDPLKN